MNEDDNDVRIEIGVIEGSLWTKVDLVIFPTDVDTVGKALLTSICNLQLHALTVIFYFRRKRLHDSRLSTRTE